MAKPNRPQLDGKGVAGSFKNLGAAAQYATQVGASTLGSLGKGGGKITGGVARSAGGLVGSLNNAAASVITAMPRVSFVLAIYAAVKGGMHLWRKRQDKKAEEAAVVQVDTPPQPSVAQGGQGYAASMPQQEMGMPMQYGAPLPSHLTPEQQALLGELQALEAQQHPAMGQGQGNLRQDWARQISTQRQQQSLVGAGKGTQHR